MIFRVPLQLQLVDAVVCRLDPEGTRLSGLMNPAPQGYDDVFREPIVSDLAVGSSVYGRNTARVESPPVRVPCQVETQLYGALSQAFAGGLPQNQMSLVMHRQDLMALNLIDVTTGNIRIAVGDRVTQLERKGLGVPILTFLGDGLFITEVRPASFGFGPDGYDLHVIVLEQRDTGTR